MKHKWLECLQYLESEVSSQKFKPWIKPLQYIAYDESKHQLRLGLGSVLKLNMVKENFLPLIESAVRRQFDQVSTVILELQSPAKAQAIAAPLAAHNRTPLAPGILAGSLSARLDEIERKSNEKTTTSISDGANGQPSNPPIQMVSAELPFDAIDQNYADAEPSNSAEPSAPQEIAPQRNNAARLIPEFTFNTLVDGKSNQMAVSAAMQVVGQPGVAYNPLFLYGGVGLGKTHLLNAIGNAFLQRNPQARISYLHAQAYFDEMVLAIQRRTPHEFKRKYQSLDLLLIDDIQFLSNRERTQEEFFYTFEGLLSARKQMVITCDTYPRHLSAFQERLRSRFASGLIVEIEPPELELRVAILLKKAVQLKRERPEFPPLTEDVAFFIAQNVRSNVRELEGALIRTLAFASFRGLALTLEVAREASRDLIKQNQLPISIEHIQKSVADFFKIRIADMYSKRRPANIARARQVAMYLAKEMTQKSFPEIGDAFGGRDHTTVMHAVKRINELRQQDTELNRQIHILEQTLSD